MISFHVLELSTPNYLFCDSQKTLILNYIYKKKKERKRRGYTWPCRHQLGLKIGTLWLYQQIEINT